MQTPNVLINGHDACACYIEYVVAELLLHPFQLYQAAQAALLGEVETVFTQAVNEMLAALISEEEVWDTLLESILIAAHGTDGINKGQTTTTNENHDICNPQNFDKISQTPKGRNINLNAKE